MDPSDPPISSTESTLILGLVVSAALASDVPYTADIERFRPAMDPFGYVTTESAAPNGHLMWSVGLWGNHANDPVVLVVDRDRWAIGNEDGDGIINHRTTVDLQTGFGVGRYFSLSVGLPIVIWQDGFELQHLDDPSFTSQLISSGVGDFRIAPKVMILDLDRLPIGMAIMGEITAPTGKERSFLGEGGVAGMPMLLVELADGSIHRREYHFRIAINAGYRWRSPATFHEVSLGNTAELRGALGLHLARMAEFGGEVNASIGTSSSTRTLEVLPFLKLLPHELLAVTAGGGIGILPGVGNPDWRVFLGMSLDPTFDPSARDSDRDGVINRQDACRSIAEDLDQFADTDGCPDLDNDGDEIEDMNDRCPNEPEDEDRFQDEDGCPDPDNDLDGFLDRVDRCPEVAEIMNSFQDDDGCPDERPLLDADGDGYLDEQDGCKFDAEDFDGFEDTDGCPDVDDDRDAILDSRDKCPKEAETLNGVFDEDGCPDIDQDGDHIDDARDQCPDNPETVNDYDDSDGCPDDRPEKVFLEKTRIRIDDTILFETNRTQILPESFPLLDDVARVIRDHPNLRRLRIEGHTDDQGNDSYNLKLSQLRAEAVVLYLTQKGVERDRLDPLGLGETRPLKLNTSPENRSLNRRVEFLIVEQD